MSKTIYDSTCPKCGNDNWYLYDTNETEFSSNGTGHYYINCHCNNCGNEWRLINLSILLQRNGIKNKD